MMDGTEEAAITVRFWDSLVAPLLTPPKVTIVTPESSFTAMLFKGFRVGKSLTGLTVTVKVRVAVLFSVPSSRTVTEMTAVPC